MEANLRGLFDRALEDEPGAPPGDLAGAAMAAGTRMRRRRRLLAGSAALVAVAALSTAGGLAWQASRPEVAPPGVLPAAAALAPRAGCVTPVDEFATNVSVFLRQDATETQRTAMFERLDTDERVREWSFETREQAYEKFRELWRDSPDFVQSVGPESLPESFQIRLRDPRDSAQVTREWQKWDGVQEVLGSRCP